MRQECKVVCKLQIYSPVYAPALSPEKREDLVSATRSLATAVHGSNLIDLNCEASYTRVSLQMTSPQCERSAKPTRKREGLVSAARLSCKYNIQFHIQFQLQTRKVCATVLHETRMRSSVQIAMFFCQCVRPPIGPRKARGTCECHPFHVVLRATIVHCSGNNLVNFYALCTRVNLAVKSLPCDASTKATRKREGLVSGAGFSCKHNITNIICFSTTDWEKCVLPCRMRQE